MVRDYRITSYSMADKIFSKAKSPKDGRPYGTGARLFKQENGDIEVHVFSEHVATFKPDNTLVVKGNTQITWGQFYRYLGLVARRRNTVGRKYEIRHCRAPSYMLVADSMTFNSTTGEYLNAPPETKRERVPDADREWRRTLIDFRKGLKVRCKLGVYDELVMGYQTKVHDCNRGAPLMASELLKMIRESDYDRLAERLITPRYIYYWQWHENKTSRLVLTTFERVYEILRDQIRTELGCFEEVPL